MLDSWINTVKTAPPKVWRGLGLVFLLAYFAAGVLYSLVHVTAAPFADEKDYLALSDHLRHGPGFSIDGVNLTAYRPPGYAFFLATIQGLGGTVAVVRIIQFALLCGGIWLIARLCPKTERVSAVLVSVGLVALYPALFYTSGTLYPQTLGGFLFLLCFALYLPTSRRPARNFAAGLVFGALILTIPGFLLTLLALLTIGWVLQINSVRDALIILFAAALVVTPWTLRNAVVFHQFVPFSSNSGVNFLLGNCGDANVSDGGDAFAVGHPMYHYSVEVARLNLNEFQADHFFRQAAWDWIRQHPIPAAVLYLKKVLNFFAVWNRYAVGSTAEISAWKQIVMAISYLFLLGLVAWRLWEARRFPLIPTEKLFLILYLISAFTMAIFLPRIRLRLPYDYLLLIVIAMHLCRRLDLWLKSNQAIPR